MYNKSTVQWVTLLNAVALVILEFCHLTQTLSMYTWRLWYMEYVKAHIPH